MRHNSLPLQDIEILNVHSISPEVSKCQIKILYVGQEANRNGSIITEEMAREQLANSVRGCPIVGKFNDTQDDFMGHEREIQFEDDDVKLIDVTRPYGFVDINAPVWFETFEDDGVPHKYLVTEGYIWTGRYPETKKIIEEGRGQSMELNEDLTGSWTKDDNGNPEFFIINEAIITKLCILGEEVEPCFEGASITKMQYSFDDEFKNEVYEFMAQMREILRKGDTTVENKELLDEVVESVEEPVVEEQQVEEPVAEEEPQEEVQEEEPVQEPEAEELVPEEEPAPEAKYNLAEVVEYTELSEKYTALETTYNSLNDEIVALREENAALKTFKLEIERKDKENMIAKFYMLSEEDKADVREHIDEYSLDEIESKLSVICVRNQVNFNLTDKEEKKEPTIFNMNSVSVNSGMPAWLKEVDDVAKNRK